MSANTTMTFGVSGEYLLIEDREFWAPFAVRMAMPLEEDDGHLSWMQFRMAMVPFANDWTACIFWGSSDLCSNYQVYDLEAFNDRPETVEIQVGQTGPDADGFDPQLKLPRQTPQRAIALLDAIARWERGVVGDLPD